MIYVDNGACYQAKQFKLMAARLPTNLVFATAFCPEGKGKVERWIQTVQDGFMEEAQLAEVETIEKLNTFFWGWLDSFYHKRKHSTTGQTPEERWKSEVGKVRTIEPEKLVDVFLWEEERTVEKSGVFKLDGNSYPVSEHLVREKVQVRFNPFDMEKVRVYHSGVFVEVVSPSKLTSHTYSKALPRRHDKAAPLESSKAFRRQVSEEYQKQVQDVLSGLPQNGESDFLSQRGFFELLKTVLSRQELRIHEQNLAFEFFQRYAPISKDVAEKALMEIVSEKGNRLHLRPYLRKVKDALAGTKVGR